MIGKIDIQVATSIRDLGEEAWNGCFADIAEDYAYLLATEVAGIEKFACRYLAAWHQGRLIAAVPAFLTEYSIDTTLEGGMKKLAGAITSLFPNLLTMRLAGLGSPVMESGRFGFHPSFEAADRPVVLRRMVEAFERYASADGYSLFGLKDVPVFQQTLWEQALSSLGYKAIPGMPTAELEINFSSLEDYLGNISAGTRKNMRRKLRSLNHIRTEHRDNIDDVLPAVMDLYHQTRGRADMRFEELTPQFFQNVLRLMPGRAFMTLYYVDDRLLGANLLLHNGRSLLDKYFCMDTTGRDYNLYFLSWFTNVQYCLDHGLTCYQSGQSAYDNKVRLGSELVRTSMFFRHRNRVVQGALKLASPLFAADQVFEEAA